MEPIYVSPNGKWHVYRESCESGVGVRCFVAKTDTRAPSHLKLFPWLAMTWDLPVPKYVRSAIYRANVA